MIQSDSQAQPARFLIESFSREFSLLQAHWRSIIDATTDALLYEEPCALANGTPIRSVCDNVLRSAAAVEQTFGGITANLWDDPFEWTLPETLSSRARIVEYLNEVEMIRERGFASFTGDADLSKVVSAPSGEFRPLASLLLETLARASYYGGQAVTTLKMLSGATVSRFII